MIENNIKIEEILNIIQKACNDKLVGYIQINFYLGGITNINRYESMKLKIK